VAFGHATRSGCEAAKARDEEAVKTRDEVQHPRWVGIEARAHIAHLQIGHVCVGAREPTFGIVHAIETRGELALFFEHGHCIGLGDWC